MKATPEQKENLIASIKQWSTLTGDALEESADQVEQLCNLVETLRAENAHLTRQHFKLLARAEEAETALAEMQAKSLVSPSTVAMFDEMHRRMEEET